MQSAANDNGGSASIDLAATAGAVMANAIRVMRGSGKPELVSSHIKELAGYIYESDAAVGKAETSELVASGLVEWSDFHKLDGDTAEKVFLNGVIDGSLLAVAACMTGNELQFAKARKDIFSAVHRLVEERRRKEIERLVAAANDNPTISNEINLYNGIMDGRPADCFVYFIYNGEAIKIGKSVNPSKRLSSLQTAHHGKLELLAVMPGDAYTEGKLHAMFAEHRLNGEWFKDCEEIRNYIAGADQKVAA